MSLSRRTFFQHMAVSGMMLGGCKSSEPQEEQGNALDPKHPNVLMLVVDDLNDWVGYLGANAQIQTPHMDALAAKGAYFTRAYCNAPWCNPSRSSALTGLMPSRTGVTGNEGLRKVSPHLVTLPQHFRQYGYKTFGAGKVFHYTDAASWTYDYGRPIDPLPSASPKANHWCPLGSKDKNNYWDWAPLDIDEKEMSDSRVADAAIAFLNSPQDAPFFMGVGFYRPHVGWYVPRKYFNLYPKDKIILPEILKTDLNDIPESGRAMAWWGGNQGCIETNDVWRDAVQGYMASITFSDAQVGRVLEAFYSSPYVANTIVVLWSDNGYHLGEKLHWHKTALWEKTLRVPFIIVPPQSKFVGQAVSPCVSLLDIFPTLIDYCGLPMPQGIQGRSLKPLLDNPSLPWRYPALSILNQSDYSLRTEQWRYIRYANGEEELYDHHTDAKEWHNLANKPEYAELKAQLYAQILSLV